MEEKKSIRPQKPEALNCPRCNSSHTKFCYYNNYSLSQPRYFCKTCRRYWTEGGSLRNVPVGGGSRRNKRSSSTTSSSSSSVATIAANSISKNQNQMMMVQQVPSLITQNPSKTIIQGQSQSQDLNLGYPTNISLQFGNLPSSISDPSPFSSAMEFLKSGFADPRQAMMNSLPNTMFMNSPAGLNFSLDGFQNNGGYHHLQGGGGLVTSHQGTMSTITTTSVAITANARILFPFENLKPISTSNSTELLEATRGQLGESSSGYNWGAGGLGSGGSW